ncbi:MAG: GntR family transcriptional regulator [Clostridiales bacterium]|nr:GntR family transcriptional regulator [Clostridiales bacterium]
MTYVFDDKTPIYLQLANIFKISIANGTWPIGGRVDTVRDLAMRYQVNPNTVQRALSELEREDLVFSERTSGRYITKDEEVIRNIRASLASRKTSEYIEQMSLLGFDGNQILSMTEKHLGEEGNGASIKKGNDGSIYEK